MKDEAEPITPDEFILRLIWADFLKPRQVPISRRAFEPKPTETDGISFYRLACLNNPLDALAAIKDPAKRPKYGIALLAVKDILALSLTIIPKRDPNSPVPGHVVIPELNTINCISDKAHWYSVQQKLAELASKNIIHRPSQ
jgi:hypothetical protein